MEYSFAGYVLFAVLFAGGYYIISKAVIWSQDPIYFFKVWKIKMMSLPKKVKRRIWDKRILLWWNKSWIRKDEFHESLDFRRGTIVEMSKEEFKKHQKDVVKRREKYRDSKKN